MLIYSVCNSYLLVVIVSVMVYPMYFKMHRDGKGANPREHSELCDRGECSQQRGNLKDNGYIYDLNIHFTTRQMMESNVFGENNVILK
ncbi:hypothetical protein [Photorhabdus bodei]|uniref:Uncharacterized protein n=1 Tax=Photorhabdus bodei TaxID=2029681 RepID=A0ABX0APA6_9GAMM|nr:hypothetical protein [Photorhabdus bodei]NDK99837.1 hypothetical protein [Photorhabdus bodei]NDL04029.1 hypothetical protein [Photorhabdus bodei]NDL08018.1 hypothetical protein [Photorhabdus bodei]